MRARSLYTFILLHMSFILSAQLIVKVPEDFNTIQAALNNVNSGTRILVSPGIYYENIIWPEYLNQVELIGEEGKEVTIIDGQQNGRVMKIVGEWTFNENQSITNQSTFQGFTIRNGLLNNEDGAGLLIENASPKLLDLLIINNTLTGNSQSYYGAGAHLDKYRGIIDNCDFVDNQNNSDFANGGGLSLAVSAEVHLKNCNFKTNEINSTELGHGGGLHITSSSFNAPEFPSVKITDCNFYSNSINTGGIAYGGGTYFDYYENFIVEINNTSYIKNNTETESYKYGGGLFANPKNIIINNSIFLSNSSGNGGGLYLANSPNDEKTALISNTEFAYNIAHHGLLGTGAAINTFIETTDLTLENCVIHHNEGGSIGFDFIFLDVVGGLTLNNCTIAYNEEPIQIHNMNFTSHNSIFWENGTEEIVDLNDTIVGSIELISCIVKNGFEGVNIIDADPTFISESILIPTDNSPCQSNGIPLDIHIDLTGYPRPMPANSYPDIGAYEVDQYFAHVLVKFFLDENEDGVKDETEPYTSLGSVKVNEEKSYNNFRKEGVFIIAEQGTLSLKYDYSWDPNWEATGQSEFAFNVDSEDYSELIELGIAAKQNFIDLQAVITSGNFRCGEEVNFSMDLKNKGTTVEDGILWLQLDARVEEFTFSKTPDYIDGNSVGWNFTNLLPTECLTFNFTITAPLIANQDQLGELYCFIATVEGVPRPLPFIYKAELRCAFDPNDKMMQPFREDSLALNSTPLVYKIRFQNTGNDYARNVVIRDTIDSNLDMSSFEIINTSHPEKLLVTLDEDRAINFDFQEIFLPDSITNEPASHGHIVYSISPKEDVELYTEVKNTAHIYFDFNPPIVTNTTSNKLVDEFPVVSTNNTEKELINFHPNPATDFLYFERTVDLALIYDINGKLVINQKGVTKIDVNKLNEGTYFIKFQVDGKTYSNKFIKAE